MNYPNILIAARDRGPASQDSKLADVFFVDVEKLVPVGLAGPAVRKWLQAPIAGLPLFKRLFEPLVGKKVGRCLALPSLVAFEIQELTLTAPCFGMQLEVCVTDDLKRGDCASFDASGLLIFDPVLGHEPQVLRVDSFDSLLRISRMALEGDLLGRPVYGVMDGDLLRAPRTRVPPGTKVIGVAAVGEGSRIGEGVVLGPGAVVGQSCTIGSDVTLSDCLILNGSRVPAGSTLVDVIWVP